MSGPVGGMDRSPARGHVFILVGPSGGGKTTLIRALSGRTAAGGRPFTFIPSTTSRVPRTGERDGVDYHFVDERTFAADVAAGQFLEWQRVHDHRYGSSRRRLREAVDAGTIGLIQADILGAFKIKAAMPADATTVFITPSRTDILRDRILGRGGVTPDDLARRLARVKMEMQMAYACDKLVINDELDQAVLGVGLLARARHLESVRLSYFGARPVVRMLALAGAPTFECGARFCVADCETHAMAALRVVRQWWWELHPGATAFALPACTPTATGAHVEELAEAILDVAEWDSHLTAPDWSTPVAQ